MAARSMRASSSAFAYAGLSSYCLLAPGAAAYTTTASPSTSHSLSGGAGIAAPPFTCRSSPLILPVALPQHQQQCASYSVAAVPPASSVSYRLAVSYCGKGRRVDARHDVSVLDLAALRSLGRCAIAGAPPHSGQDAFFMGALGNGRKRKKYSRGSSALEDTGVEGAGGSSSSAAYGGHGAGTSEMEEDGADVVFGVADGVGGWVDNGIDPSAFSEGLCRYMAAEAGAWDERADGTLGARRLMQEGYDAASDDPDIEGGGSTAVVAVGRADGRLEVANLGDSGFVHYRPNATSFASPPQVHAFNTPYQLSLIPEDIMERSRAFGGEPLHDYPSDAAVTSHTVAHGDVLVFASDGVWDNLSSGDVLDVVRNEMDASGAWVVQGGGGGGGGGETEGKGAKSTTGQVVGAADLGAKTDWRREAEQVDDDDDESDGGAADVDEPKSASAEPKAQSQQELSGLASVQERLAFKIVRHAQIAAADQTRVSPFGRELKRWYPNERWHGGKVDDIAVVVAVIVAR